MEERETAERIARRVSGLGGRVFYVGGCVRDELLGIVPKDIDIEVHGIEPDKLEEILQEIGECTKMGANFGIFGLKHCDLDIAMPRRENATGRGHRDFEVFVDPFIGIAGATRRRDLTVNAIMKDVLTGEICDPYHGAEDLRAGILRHVDSTSFGEDPLRVLRTAQFAARFEFAIAPETLKICSGMDLSALARERVFDETMKALHRAAHPSIYFETLRRLNQLNTWFPELLPLIGCEQDPRWHPEGDVWTHTMRVLDAAASLRGEAREQDPFLLAALLHDIGKPETTVKTEEGKIHAVGHELAGLPIAEKFLRRLTDETQLIKRTLNLVELHMRPNMYVAQGSGKKAYMRMLDSALFPEDLLLISRADRMGQALPEDHRAEEILSRMLEQYRELQKTPAVTGKDLIRAGLKPGPEFSKRLSYAHKLWLSGVPFRSALVQTLAEQEFPREKNESMEK